MIPGAGQAGFGVFLIGQGAMAQSLAAFLLYKYRCPLSISLIHSIVPWSLPTCLLPLAPCHSDAGCFSSYWWFRSDLDLRLHNGEGCNTTLLFDYSFRFWCDGRPSEMWPFAGLFAAGFRVPSSYRYLSTSFPSPRIAIPAFGPTAWAPYLSVCPRAHMHSLPTTAITTAVTLIPWTWPKAATRVRSRPVAKMPQRASTCIVGDSSDCAANEGRPNIASGLVASSPLVELYANRW